MLESYMFLIYFPSLLNAASIYDTHKSKVIESEIDSAVWRKFYFLGSYILNVGAALISKIVLHILFTF